MIITRSRSLQAGLGFFLSFLFVALGGCKRRQTVKPTPVGAAPRVDVGAPAPLRPQTLTIQVPAIPTQLNPLLGGADVWCRRITMSTIFEPLLRRVAGGGVEPLLAERYTWSEDHRRLRLDLRHGVTFHDGRPMTADDVIYTLDRLRRRHTVNRRFGHALRWVREVREVAAGVVEIRLARRDEELLRSLTEIAIAPAHRYRKVGLASPRLNRAPIGTGPFRFTPTADPQGLLLTRYSRYWGKKPRLDKIVFRVIAEQARTLAALRNGEIDIIPDLYTGYFPKHVTGERFKARFILHRLHPYRLRVLLFNIARPLLADRRVRMALIRGVNRPRILRAVRGQLGRILSAPVWPLSRWYDRTLHPRSYDQKAAARWLERAGWRAGRSGKRWRLDRPLKLRILRARGEVPRQVAEAIARDLSTIGVGVGIDVAEFAFFRTLLRRGRFDLAVLGIALGGEDDLAAYVHSKGRSNYGHYRNRAVDAMLDALAKEGVSADRTRDGRSLHRLLVEDPPMAVIYEPIELMVINRRVQGLTSDGRWPDLVSIYLKEFSR